MVPPPLLAADGFRLLEPACIAGHARDVMPGTGKPVH
jgi:hypothetical protein